MLTASGIAIVYFEEDENGYDTLSLNVYDCCFNRAFIMRRNDWISHTDMDDIDAPPSARTLNIRSKIRGVRLDLEFKDRPSLNQIELAKCIELGIPENENVIFCYLNGHLAAPIPVSFTPDGVNVGRLTLSGNTMSHCEGGIELR